MRNQSLSLLALAALAAVCSCDRAGVTARPFGTLSTGEEVTVFELRNRSGATVTVMDYGARLVGAEMPDRNGKFGDVIASFADLEDFEHTDRFMGPIIGRYGNRIDHSSFVLDGVRYDVVPNEDFDGQPVQCHGGLMGFDRFVWEAETLQEKDRVGVRFHRLSPDGEQGFPGNLDCSCTFWLTDANVLKLEYEAETDKPTVVNLSNHAYFNLKGDEGGYVMDHLFTVEADTCVLNNLHFCPDRLLPVDGTPFDFREPHRVDYRLDMPDRHLTIMRGMSACWKVRGYDGTLRKAADLYERRSGRGVETWTTEPALLTYTGRNFNGTQKGKYGPIEKYGAMLLETIHFADSPNQDRFPSTVLRPGEKYYTTTEYRFYAR